MNLKSLVSWSKSEFTHLPWRQNRSLYRTLVSEIMLQQTTVGTVLNHFERFLKRFPTLESLAEASEEELTIAWKGLGYYRRARNLKKIAETIQFEHNGVFPDDLQTLMEIPGIGPYTANAIIAIGMDQRGLAVDANLERVIARVFGINIEKGIKLQKEIQERFKNKKIFNEKVSWRGLNEALMDLGRTFCQSRKASCELCPLNNDCIALKENAQLQYPLSTVEKKAEDFHELDVLRLLVMKGNKVLTYQKTSKQWLSGQWELPTLILKTTDKNLKQYPYLKGKLPRESIVTYKTTITKYKITNRVLVVSEKEAKAIFQEKTEWSLLEGDKSNLSTASIKAIEKYQAIQK